MVSTPREPFTRRHARLGAGGNGLASPTELAALASEIDLVLERGFRWQSFPRHLEALFERETEDERARHLVSAGFVAVVIYIFFLFSDLRMIPDVLGTAVVVRLLIVTPLSLAVIFALWWGVRPVLREAIESAMMVISAVSIIALVVISEHPNAAYYSNRVLLVIIFANAVVRLRFWYAISTSLLILLAYLGLGQYARVVPVPEIQLTNFFTLVTAVIFTLVANYSLERDHRRNYLLGVRERIRATELASSNARLRELSHLDPLTGIANRRELDQILERTCRNKSDPEPFSIIMLDVDCFKEFNDLYGHTEGDDCLRRIASLLQASLRHTGDRVARYGGEEFVVVLPRTAMHHAIEVAERMLRSVSDLAIPHTGSPIGSVVTLSAGIATDQAPVEPTRMLARADAALYRAKAAGRNRVEPEESAGRRRTPSDPRSGPKLRTH